MKLICDCGSELKFIIEDESNRDENDSVYACKKGDINLCAEHDHLWITCEKCDRAIYIFT